MIMLLIDWSDKNVSAYLSHFLWPSHCRADRNMPRHWKWAAHCSNAKNQPETNEIGSWNGTPGVDTVLDNTPVFNQLPATLLFALWVWVISVVICEWTLIRQSLVYLLWMGSWRISARACEKRSHEFTFITALTFLKCWLDSFDLSLQISRLMSWPYMHLDRTCESSHAIIQ